MSEFKKYKCETCGHIYDEEKGDPETGIKPGTFWSNVPESWECPDCGASKDMFVAIS